MGRGRLAQGYPEAGFMYCVACHEEVKGLDRDLAAAGGKVVFGNDDGYAIGPPEVVFPAIDKFASEVKEKHGLTLQVNKTKIYHRLGIIPQNASLDMSRAGELINENWCPSFTFLIGED